MFRIFAFVALYIAANTAVAQTSAVTLQELLQRATENSLGVDAQKLQVESNQNLVGAATAWSNPVIHLEGQRGDDNTGMPINNYKVSAQQNLPSPFTTFLKKDLAKIDVAISKHHLEDTVLQTQVTVYKWIYEYTVLRHLVKVMQDRLTRLQVIKKYIATRHYLSPQKRSEVFVIENKITMIEKDLMLARSTEEYKWQRLNIYLKWDDKASFPDFWINKPIQLDKQALLDKALRNNHDIEFSNLELQKMQTQKKLESRTALPEFGIVASDVKGRQGNPEDNKSLGVSMTVPLFNWNRSRTHATESLVSVAERKKQITIQQVSQNFESYFSQFTVLQNFLLAHPISDEKKLNQQMQFLTESFKKGQVDLITYFEVDMTHYDRVQQNYVAQQEFAASLAELSLLSGEIFNYGNLL